MLAFSEACERNKDPILAVLREACVAARSVLEIGAGTGQHAVYFAAALPQLVWQPTDRPEHLAALAERVRLDGGPNLRAPRPLDVGERPWSLGPVDAVFSANTLHIMSWPMVEAFFAGTGEVLGHNGVLCVYGPFNAGGRYTSASNAAFDATLRRRDPLSGIRDFEAVNALAAAAGLDFVADHAMPANNRTLVWRKGPAGTPADPRDS